MLALTSLHLSALQTPPASARARASMLAPEERKRIAILGASGYTGAELCRLLQQHPYVTVTALTSERYAGKSLSDVFPQFAAAPPLPLSKLEDVDWSGIDLAFACLPHATTQAVVLDLPPELRIVDLSADFRLRDTAMYEKWYGGEHIAPALQTEAVYGLTELSREAVRTARLVANPGCYPTAAQLPLVPLLAAALIEPNDIIIDAKSGTTGAGRAPKEATLFCEVTDGIHAYGVSSHRHAPEIEQGLSEAAGEPVTVNFTPHLMPMSRGILESIYVKTRPGTTAKELRATLQAAYADEPFVTILPDKVLPQTRHVRGSNHCFISVVDDRLPGRAIVIAVIDNLVKGASGQAIQNMNVMLGFPESTAIEAVGSFP